MEHLGEIRAYYCKQYGKLIKSKRRVKNISQDELAKQIEVSRATVSRYESGAVDIPASLLPVISELCGFKFREYVAEKEPILLSKKTVDALWHAFIHKGAHLSASWSLERYKKEQEKLISEVKTLMECFDKKEEFFCYLQMMEPLDKFEEWELSDAQKDIQYQVSHKIHEMLDTVPGLEEAMRNLSAVTQYIEDTENTRRSQ